MTDLEQKKVFAANLKQYLSLHELTQKEVADAIHVLPQTFNTWCQGKALPRMKKIQLLADYFHIKKSSLIDPVEKSEEEKLIISGISALPANAGFHADFVLKASGDSMTGAGIMDGDMIFIRKQKAAENGEITAVSVNDEALLKRFYYYPEEEKIILRSENPDCPDIVITGKKAANIQVLGRAVGLFRQM